MGGLHAIVIGLALCMGLPVYAFSSASYNYDQSYGRFSQCENSLRDLGLFADNGESALCGPISICNLLKKFRKHLRFTRKRDHLEEVRRLTFDVMPEHDIRNHGMQPESLAELAVRYFSELNINSEVRIWEFPDTRVFQNTLRADTGVVIEFDWWPNEEFRAEDPWQTPYEDGHFVVVVGVHRFIPGRLLILDPWQPTRLLELELVPKKSKTGRSYYLIHWPNKESPAQPAERTAILRAALQIKVSQKWGSQFD